MKTLLVPVDFSATAKNAAMYALQLAEQLNARKLVLYHSYEIPVTIDPMVPGVQVLDTDSLKEASEKGLRNLKAELALFAKDIKLDTMSEYGAMSAGLDELCDKTNAGLVIMGITGGGVIEEKLIGSNAVTVAKHTKVPVIIVPSTATFVPIQHIMLTSDFDKSDRTIPVKALRKILTETEAKLFVLNTEKEEYADKYGSDGVLEEYALPALLADMDVEYHFSTDNNYMETVNDFALEFQVDLIITIPKQHGFFESLFTANHTNQLAFHSHVPVMVIHE